MPAIGVLGGTFNPVHNGHIQFAQDFSKVFDLDEVRLIPCALPAHRVLPELSADIRFKLLKAAVHGLPKLVADDIELQAAKHSEVPSFTVNTLRCLREQYGAQTPIYFAMGIDAFEHFEQWHDWQDILTLANIVVVERPGYSVKAVLNLPSKQWLSSFEPLFTQHKTAAGTVYLQTLSLLDISSTFIREQLRQNKSVCGLVPDAVEHLMKEQHLYSVK